MADTTHTTSARAGWREQDDGWAVLFGLMGFLRAPFGDWDIVEDLVETEEFGGLWWW
ncbi:MAG: hypothetical protein AAGA47_06560 [Pseudomonadota bacterium]